MLSIVLWIVTFLWLAGLTAWMWRVFSSAPVPGPSIAPAAAESPELAAARAILRADRKLVRDRVRAHLEARLKREA